MSVTTRRRLFLPLAPFMHRLQALPDMWRNVPAARRRRLLARFGKATLEPALTRRFAFSFKLFSSRCRCLWRRRESAESCILRVGITLFDDGCGKAEWALAFAEEGSRGFVWVGESELVEAFFVDCVTAWETDVDSTGGNEDGAQPAGVEFVAIQLCAYSLLAIRQDSEGSIHRQVVAGRQDGEGSVHGETREESRSAAAKT